MSAFICNATHVGILAAYLAGKTSKFGDATKAAEKLGRENLRSVAYRYGTTTEKAAQDYLKMSEAQYLAACRRVATEAQARYATIPHERIVGMVRCSEYQSCEHPSWEESEAKQILDFIYRFAVSMYFSGSNDRCGWEWTYADAQQWTAAGRGMSTVKA